MITDILFPLTLCLDAFVASIAYGMNQIKIPISSVLVIGLIGSLFLALSFFASNLIKQFFNPNICLILSSILLMGIGFFTLFQSVLKQYLKQLKEEKKIQFHMNGISIALDIYLDETSADLDHSKTLSKKEAILLATALSIDSLFAGFSLGLGCNSYLQLIFLSFILSTSFIFLGIRIGSHLTLKKKFDLSWLSGICFILIGLLKWF